jgi:DNA-3-methyladenine glycosylase II
VNRTEPGSSERRAALLDHLTFSLTPAAPFRLNLTAWALRRRPSNTIDVWDGATYRRVLVIDSQPVAVALSQTGGLKHGRLHIELRAGRLPPDAKRSVTIMLQRMLGLRLNLHSFHRLAARDKRIKLLVQHFRGVKPPRFPTVFESPVNGIAYQQLTLHVGILLLSRLAERFEPAVDGDGAVQHAFSRPVDLAALSPPALRDLGFSTNKARARLHALHGVGRWTAEYVLLRGLGRLDTFPGDDVGARNNLARRLSLLPPAPRSYQEIRLVGARYRRGDSPDVVNSGILRIST